MGLIYTLPDGRVINAADGFAISRSYERSGTRIWTENIEVEIAPETIVPAVDGNPELVMPAVMQVQTVEYREPMVETVTEDVQYPPGWLSRASAEDLAALGITSAPAPVDVAAVKLAAIRRVVMRADEIADLITVAVPLAERLSWPTKEAAARAVIAGSATSEQQALIGAEAQVTGEQVADLAQRIVANATRYITAAGLIAGQRRKTIMAIESLLEPATMDADITQILSAAEAEAQALLAQVMS